MQIDFTPHKIKAAKAYIENLCEDEKKVKKIEKKEKQLSFFQRLKRLFF
ncbi:hypothetical protein GSY74_08055 [Sulfurovum sp. bin170]|nr:hypothetical protein [Sulfurovum sp. bin170]NEW61234.1 hypothetical protein [Sulfurovum sp. bin170]